MAPFAPWGSASSAEGGRGTGPALYSHSLGRKAARLTEAIEKEAPDRGVGAGAERARALGCPACSATSHEKCPQNGRPWGLPHCSKGAAERAARARASAHARGSRSELAQGEGWGPHRLVLLPHKQGLRGAPEQETTQAAASELISAPPPRLPAFPGQAIRSCGEGFLLETSLFTKTPVLNSHRCLRAQECTQQK